MLRTTPLIVVGAALLALAPACNPPPVDGEGEGEEGEGEEGEGEEGEGEEGEGEEGEGEGEEGEGEGEPPPVPANDTCAAAVALEGANGSFDGTLAGATNDVNATNVGDCTEFDSTGPDTFHTFTVAPQSIASIVFSADDDDDVALFALTDCTLDADACIAGIDDGTGGAPETLVIPNTTDTALNVVIVADYFTSGADGSTYTLTWTTAAITIQDEGESCAEINELCNPAPGDLNGDGTDDELFCNADDECQRRLHLADGATCTAADVCDNADADCVIATTGGGTVCAVIAEPAEVGGDCVVSATGSSTTGTAFPCAAGLACIDETCVDPVTFSCDTRPTAAVLGGAGNPLTIDNADFDFLRGSCSSTARREQPFFYTVAATDTDAAIVSATVTGNGARAVYFFTDCNAGIEDGCGSGTNAAFASTKALVAGSVINVVVEAELNSNVNLIIAEQGVNIVGNGETCDATIPNAPTVANLCGEGLACVNNECEPDDGGRNAPVSVELPVVDRALDINPIGDADCYTFIVTTPSSLNSEVTGACTTQGTNDALLTVFRVTSRNGAGDAITTSVTSDDNTGDGDCPRLTNSNLGVGENLVCVTESGDNATAGDLLLDISLTPKITDADGSTYATPTPVAVPSTTAYDVIVGDADCFSFTLDATTDLHIDNEDCAGDSLMNLFDANDQLLVRDDDGADSGLCSSLDRVLPAGDYKVCLDEFGNDATSAGNVVIAVNP